MMMPTRPIVRPRASRRTPWPKMRARMSERWAPSARRMPISRRRLQRIVGENAVEADAREQKSQPGENEKEKGDETRGGPGLLDALEHRANFVDGLRGIDCGDDVADGFFERGGIALRADKQDEVGSLYLCLREIDDWERGNLIEAAHLYACDDADDFEEPPLTSVVRVDAQALADGILSVEKLIGSCLVYDCDQGRRVAVVLIEDSSLQQSSLESGEIISPNDLGVGGSGLTRRRLGRAFAQNIGLPAGHHRRIRAERRVDHARQRANALEQSVGKLRDLFVARVDAEGKIEMGREQTARLEAERERLRSRKTFENETRRAQKHESERDLADDEPVACAARSGRIGAAARAGVEGQLHIGFRRHARGPEAEEEIRAKGEAEA